MENPGTSLNNQNKSEPVSAAAKPRFGMIGLIIGIPGFLISAGTAYVIYFIGMAGGGLDIMLTDRQWATIVYTLYCGLFFGILGGIFGAVGLSRGEHKTAGMISILLALPALCICSAAIYLRVLLRF